MGRPDDGELARAAAAALGLPGVPKVGERRVLHAASGRAVERVVVDGRPLALKWRDDRPDDREAALYRGLAADVLAVLGAPRLEGAVTVGATHFLFLEWLEGATPDWGDAGHVSRAFGHLGRVHGATARLLARGPEAVASAEAWAEIRPEGGRVAGGPGEAGGGGAGGGREGGLRSDGEAGRGREGDLRPDGEAGGGREGATRKDGMDGEEREQRAGGRRQGGEREPQRATWRQGRARGHTEGHDDAATGARPANGRDGGTGARPASRGGGEGGEPLVLDPGDLHAANFILTAVGGVHLLDFENMRVRTRTAALRQLWSDGSMPRGRGLRHALSAYWAAAGWGNSMAGTACAPGWP